MRRFLSLILFAAPLLWGCTVEPAPQENGVRTLSSFTASIDPPSGTRAHIEQGTKIVWDNGDEIGVFSDRQDAAGKYTKISSGNAFEGSPVTGSKFYSWYPYGDFRQDASTPRILKGELAAGAVGSGYLKAPMVAVSDGENLHFKHTCGLLHISIKAAVQINEFAFYANGFAMAGNGSIDLSEAEPVFRLDPDANITGVSDIVQNQKAGEPVDIWIVMPPMTLPAGFTFTVIYTDKNRRRFEMEKTVTQSVTFSRAVIKNYSLIDIDAALQEEEEMLAKEKAALIALYNATGGPNWTYKTNWCSEKTLYTWEGLEVDDSGHVTSLRLFENNLSGTIPDEIADLKYLRNIELVESSGTVNNIEKFLTMPSLEVIKLGRVIGPGGRYPSGKDDPYCIEIPTGIGALKSLKSLEILGIKGSIPEDLYDLATLENIRFDMCTVEAPLSPSIGKLRNLTSLQIYGYHGDGVNPDIITPLNGPIPDELYDLTGLRQLVIGDCYLSGGISPKIGNLTNLYSLNLCGNKLSGNLPVEMTRLRILQAPVNPAYPIRQFDLTYNGLSGKVPAKFQQWPDWNSFWGYIVEGNALDISDAMPWCPSFDVVTTTGSHYTSEMLKNNELTALFQWWSDCPWTPSFTPVLESTYNAYKDKGFAVLSWSPLDNDATVASYVASHGWQWPSFRAWREPDSSGGNLINGAFELFPTRATPGVCVYDRYGQLVFSSVLEDRNNLRSFADAWFAEGDAYSSTDYSRDGTVTTLQTASRGNGIDLVIMGDAFSDRLIADGTFSGAVAKAVDGLFSVEPYSSLRDRFNIYQINVVSKNEKYPGKTALDGRFGEGTEVGGDDSKVIAYARKSISDSRMDDALIVVLMNSHTTDGTCYMYSTNSGDYGRGTGIAYLALGAYEGKLAELMIHEAGGHGFSKLGDEYSYGYMGEIPQDKKASYTAMEQYGWYKNISFISHPQAVKWARFISDSRYSAEGIGCYEGGLTYPYGVWHPTLQSVMNYGVLDFNAPSRQAIWYRAMKLSEGENWNAGYEDFVSFDAPARARASVRRKKVQKRPFAEEELHTPPVVRPYSWRETVKRTDAE